MGILDGIDKPDPRTSVCMFGDWINQLDDDDKTALLSYLENITGATNSYADFTSAGLSRDLGKRGVHMKEHTIRRHVRGDCACR